MTARILPLRRGRTSSGREEVRRVLDEVRAIATVGLTGGMALEDAVFAIDQALRPAVRHALAGPIDERRRA